MPLTWIIGPPATAEERTSLETVGPAIAKLVPVRLNEVRTRRAHLVTTTMAAAKDSGRARQRAGELQVRLQRRMVELDLERQIALLPPVAIGGSLVPIGLLPNKLLPSSVEPNYAAAAAVAAEARKQMEPIAMQRVIEAEKQLGNEPRDVSGEKCGFDIESNVADGKLRFIEVKGRAASAITVTVSKEVLTALNKPEDFIRATGQVDVGQRRLVYIRQPFQQEPYFAVESINYNLQELPARGEPVLST